MRVPSGGRPVKEVGEFPLIDMIDGVVSATLPRRLRMGIGDDAAVWRPRPGRDLVFTTDILVQNVHFRLDWMDWQAVGHKALAVNLSDVAAMGAQPRLALVSLALTGSERDREVTDLFRGMNALGRRHGVVVAGGDLSASPNGVVVSVTVIGETSAGRRAVMTRDGARPGDIIGVTGPLGMAAAGLRVFQQQLLTLDGNPAMREAYSRPKPRVREGRLLARAGVRAAMDLSDGLLGDLPKMCEASGVSVQLEEDALPIPRSVRWNFPDWWEMALRGGEDFELLFTASPETFERVQHLFRRFRLTPPIAIGKLTSAKGGASKITLRTTDQRRAELTPGAWDHFASDRPH